MAVKTKNNIEQRQKEHQQHEQRQQRRRHRLQQRRRRNDRKKQSFFPLIVLLVAAVGYGSAFSIASAPFVSTTTGIVPFSSYSKDVSFLLKTRQQQQRLHSQQSSTTTSTVTETPEITSSSTATASTTTTASTMSTMPGATTVTSSSSTSDCSIPNWRVLPLSTVLAATAHSYPDEVAVVGSSLEQKQEGEENDDADSNHRLLTFLTSLLNHPRPVWSEAAYAESLELYHKLKSCQDSYVAGPIAEALNVIDHAYRLYGPESVLTSFNGGKDAVVILHLVRAVHAKWYYDHHHHRHHTSSSTAPPPPIVRPRCIYFDQKNEFQEVTAFLQSAVTNYDLDMIAFEQGVKFPRGLQVLVEHNLPQSVSVAVKTTASAANVPPFPLAIVLGTRTTDPNAGTQGHFAPSSHYMPPFMRVNPIILDWTYGHIWHFLRLFQLPYCSLYDQGFTSLGTTKDTLPCPALAVAGATADGNNTHLPKYWPAYMLRDWDQERAGRIDKTKGASTSNKNTTKTKKKSSSASKSQQQQQQQLQQQQQQQQSRPPQSVTTDASETTVGNLSVLSEIRANPVVSVSPQMQQQQQQQQKKKDGQDGSGRPLLNASSCVSFSSDTVTRRSVGVLIIGDEILKGFTADANTHAAAKALFDQNVLLKRVVVVSDNLQDICQEIRRLDDQVDVIITSGGVGPTHDDVTIKGVAAALESDMVLHEEMGELLKDKMNKGDNKGKDVPLTEAQIKMATLPSISKLRYLSGNPKDWPVLQCHNIFILPGIPEFFSSKIENVAKYLSCQLERGAAYKVVLSVDENSIVTILNQVVENHPKVSIGSYPFVSHPEYKTVITVEGRFSEEIINNSHIYDRSMIEKSKQSMDKYVELALDELIHKLPEGSVLRVDNDDMMLFN